MSEDSSFKEVYHYIYIDVAGHRSMVIDYELAKNPRATLDVAKSLQNVGYKVGVRRTIVPKGVGSYPRTEDIFITELERYVSEIKSNGHER